LLTLLGEPDPAIRGRVLAALAEISSRESVPALCDHLRHENREVRGWVARSLGRIGDPRALAALTERLETEPDPWCREEMQQALVRVAHREATSLLAADALAGNDAGILAVLDGLDLLRQQELGRLLRATRSNEPEIWGACARAVREYREAASIPVLIELLGSSDLTTRTEACKLLRALSGRDQGFEPEQDEARRRDGQQKWALWWKQNGPDWGARR
jgi:HEAT repeat protein